MTYNEFSFNVGWQDKHNEVINSFLKYINSSTDKFILKGGTALMTCYNLDRFSEDIDMDGKKGNIEKLVDSFCKQNDYTYRVAKNTDTVKRYMINYGNENRPLKLEISFRDKDQYLNKITKINNITVYDIETLCSMKASAYNNRDKLRDLYDLAFICNNYWDRLSDDIKVAVQSAVLNKGIEQFDYLIREQKDELINNNKLAEDFLKMYRLIELYKKRDTMSLNEWKSSINKERENNSGKDLRTISDLNNKNNDRIR